MQMSGKFGEHCHGAPSSAWPSVAAPGLMTGSHAGDCRVGLGVRAALPYPSRWAGRALGNPRGCAAGHVCGVWASAADGCTLGSGGTLANASPKLSF